MLDGTTEGKEGIDMKIDSKTGEIGISGKMLGAGSSNSRDIQANENYQNMTVVENRTEVMMTAGAMINPQTTAH